MSDGGGGDGGGLKPFWCHACNARVQIDTSGALACPTCQADFVEELPDDGSGGPDGMMMDDDAGGGGFVLPIPPLRAGAGGAQFENFLQGLAMALQGQAGGAGRGFPPPRQRGGDDGSEGDEDEWEDEEDDEDGGEDDDDDMHMDDGDEAEIEFDDYRGRGGRAGRRANLNRAGAGVHGAGLNGRGPRLGGGHRLDIRTFLQLLSQDFLNPDVVGNPGDYATNEEVDRLVSQMLDDESNWKKPRPTDPEAIKNLAVVRVSEQDVTDKLECSVCTEQFELDEETLVLPCKHRFHPACIKPWLANNSTCPVCRTELPTVPQEEAKEAASS